MRKCGRHLFSLYIVSIKMITAKTLKVVFITFLELDCIYYFSYCIYDLLSIVTMYDKYYCAIGMHSTVSDIRLP